METHSLAKSSFKESIDVLRSLPRGAIVQIDVRNNVGELFRMRHRSKTYTGAIKQITSRGEITWMQGIDLPIVLGANSPKFQLSPHHTSASGYTRENTFGFPRYRTETIYHESGCYSVTIGARRESLQELMFLANSRFFPITNFWSTENVGTRVRDDISDLLAKNSNQVRTIQLVEQAVDIISKQIKGYHLTHEMPKKIAGGMLYSAFNRQKVYSKLVKYQGMQDDDFLLTDFGNRVHLGIIRPTFIEGGFGVLVRPARHPVPQMQTFIEDAIYFRDERK